MYPVFRQLRQIFDHSTIVSLSGHTPRWITPIVEELSASNCSYADPLPPSQWVVQFERAFVICNTYGGFKLSDEHFAESAMHIKEVYEQLLSDKMKK